MAELTAKDLRDRLFNQLDMANKQPFSCDCANSIASLASAINKSWEMQIAFEALKREIKIKKKDSAVPLP